MLVRNGQGNMKFLLITFLGFAKDKRFLYGITTCSVILLSFVSPIFLVPLKDDLPFYL